MHQEFEKIRPMGPLFKKNGAHTANYGPIDSNKNKIIQKFQKERIMD